MIVCSVLWRILRCCTESHTAWLSQWEKMHSPHYLQQWCQYTSPDTYYEDSFDVNDGMVISGDGTLRMATKRRYSCRDEVPCSQQSLYNRRFYHLLRYTIQVLSQMASKCCSSYVNVCYTHLSTTVSSGTYHSDLWSAVKYLAARMYRTESRRLTHTLTPVVLSCVRSLQISRKHLNSRIFISMCKHERVKDIINVQQYHQDRRVTTPEDYGQR